MATTKAEKAVGAAEAALSQAEAQLVALDEEIGAQKAAAAETEDEIRAKHEAGETPNADDRRKRRDALADVNDLSNERATVKALVERRKAELQTARVELSAEREGEYRTEGALLTDEVWECLGTLSDLWGRTTAVAAAQRREIDTMRRGNYGSANPPPVVTAGGLEPVKGAIEALVVATRPGLAKRIPA
ncbi:MAG: hypothetical protein ACREK5_06430 [Gemmatimonadota bacterium]